MPGFARALAGENGWLAPHRVGRNQDKTHDGTIVTDKVNEMWGTDMSQTVTLEAGRAYVFVAVEHANSEIIGIHAALSANRFGALEPVRQELLRCHRARRGAWAQAASRSCQPEGNGVAERFIRTLKENLLWVRAFKVIKELRAELVAFARR